MDILQVFSNWKEDEQEFKTLNWERWDQVSDIRNLRTLISKTISEGTFMVWGSDELIVGVVSRLMYLGALNKVKLLIVQVEGSSILKDYLWNPTKENHQLRIVPLIRDETGMIILGPSTLDAQSVHGECYVDEKLLKKDEIYRVEIEPILADPGLKARVETKNILGKKKWGSWVAGRACQTGLAQAKGINFPGGVGKPRKRITFYRHVEDLRVVI